MDVHRCRFVNYPPSTINAVAFSHTHLLPSQSQTTAPVRLAIGRANGDIEIWNPLRGAWHQETIIRGGKDRSIDGLVWIQDPNEDVQGRTLIGRSRLFSIGYTTSVTEWDLEGAKPLRTASGTHGEIWCLATQPKGVAADAQGQNLIAGCVDGALVLYSTKDGGLELQKVFSRPSAKKAKIISVVFKDRNVVVAGCSDSTIRMYDSRNGQLLRNMTLGAAPKGGPREIIVWSVALLANGDVVSGDSTGEIKIWDGKTNTLTQRVKAHKQDVLSLAVSTDGSTILSGGMDRRTVVYKKSGKKGRWNEVAHRRYHDNDVKTMASFEGEGISVVVSGGPDATPVVVPLRQAGFENQRALSFLPQEQVLQTALRNRLVMSWWDREVSIWRISKTARKTDPSIDPETAQKNARKLVAKILIQGEANITSASLSANGSLLAVSTISEVKLFSLRPHSDGESFKISKVVIPGYSTIGARSLQFSPDSKWLTVIRPDNRISQLRLLVSGLSVKLVPQAMKLARIDRKVEKISALGGLALYERTISQIAYSSDSRILAVSDLAGYIDTFVLIGHEDLDQTPSSVADEGSQSESDASDSDNEDSKKKPSTVYGQRWARNPQAHSIPQLPSAPTVLSFRPATIPPKQLTNGTSTHGTRHNPHPTSHETTTTEDRLFVLTATSEVYEFEVLKGTLSPWSRRNPTEAFSETFRTNRNLAKGAFWEVTNGKERVWIYSVGWLWMFDLSRDFPEPEETLDKTNTATSGRKRKRGVEKNTGAGSAIPDQELLTGMSRKFQLADDTDVPVSQFDLVKHDAMDIDENEAEESNSALALLRRGSRSETKDIGFKHEWYTYKYRPILGMGVIASSDDESEAEEGGKGFEVVVVERPIFETSLPDRYIGEQEWEKNDFVK